jgi:hypothetical protein
VTKVLFFKAIVNKLDSPDHSGFQQFVISIADGLQGESTAVIAQATRLFALYTVLYIHFSLNHGQIPQQFVAELKTAK